MNKYVFYDDRTKANWERVSKAKAFKLWQTGKEIIVCPAKLRPFAPWYLGMLMSSLERHKEECYERKPDKEHFQDSVRNFEWYNCVDSETGTFASFYVKQGA